MTLNVHVLCGLAKVVIFRLSLPADIHSLAGNKLAERPGYLSTKNLSLIAATKWPCKSYHQAAGPYYLAGQGYSYFHQGQPESGLLNWLSIAANLLAKSQG